MRENPVMPIDPLSDFLQLLDARAVVAGGLVAGGDWAVAFPGAEQIKFWGVVRGGCWHVSDEDTAPFRLVQGDVLLRIAPRPARLCSDVDVPPVWLADVRAANSDAVTHVGKGDDFFLIGGMVELGQESERLLRDVLPPFVHVRGDSPEAEPIRWLLGQLLQERENQRPGQSAASAQLIQLMFVHVLRVYMASAEGMPAGWLRALNDARLAPVLRMMHADPARAWTLNELASASSMSRAGFAAYFNKVAGIAPMRYLTEWRMRLAQRTLAEGRVPLARLAESLGYASESAFSHAFKRVTGRSPTMRRRGVADAPT
ncbi:AraC family transcriptional regulator [Luteibacter rhizovicinus]|nr:AraC family transcriptional regulator [Luteibacter rhizovicinus]